MSDNDKVHIRTIEVAAQLPVFVCDLTLIKAQLDLAREGIEDRYLGCAAVLRSRLC